MKIPRAQVAGFVALAAALGVAMLAGSTAAQSASTCFGQPATIVGGDAYEDFVGTEAPDVVLAGAGTTRFMASAATICSAAARAGTRSTAGRGSSPAPATIGSTAAPDGTTCSATAGATS
jgi:hypothetical protein